MNLSTKVTNLYANVIKKFWKTLWWTQSDSIYADPIKNVYCSIFIFIFIFVFVFGRKMKYASIELVLVWLLSHWCDLKPTQLNNWIESWPTIPHPNIGRHYVVVFKIVTDLCPSISLRGAHSLVFNLSQQQIWTQLTVLLVRVSRPVTHIY